MIKKYFVSKKHDLPDVQIAFFYQSIFLFFFFFIFISVYLYPVQLQFLPQNLEGWNRGSNPSPFLPPALDYGMDTSYSFF